MLCFCGDIWGVNSIQGLNPDLVVANSLVDAYCRCGSLIKAMQVVDLMISTSTGSDGSSSSSVSTAVIWPQPDAITFNTLLRGLVSIKAVDAGMKLMKRMEDLGITPDEISVNTLANLCVKGGDYDRAVDIVRGGGGVEGWSSIVDGLAKRGDLSGVSIIILCSGSCSS